MTKEKVAPHFYVPRPCGKGNSTKIGALQLLGTFPPTLKVLKAAVYQKQAIAYSLNQLQCGIGATNLPHILGKSTPDCLRKSWER
jgi:hypothetical protein